MAEILKGKPLADSIIEDLKGRVDNLKEHDIFPTLAVVRLGERDDDLAYERGLKNKAVQSGIKVVVKELPIDANQKQVEHAIRDLNEDERIHGVLIFKPLPKHLDEKKICETLIPEKDMDGITGAAQADLYIGKNNFYAPCTAQSCVEILKYYGVELKGKRAAVIGRSPVIGKPVSMLLLNEHATVTICHSRSQELEKICSEAEVLIACAGRAKLVDDRFINENQVIIDVGINFDENGKMVGDVAFDEVEPGVKAITPVPGGVGAVTSALLMQHVVIAAEKVAAK